MEVQESRVKQQLDIIYRPHPVLPSVNCKFAQQEWKPGQTVREILIANGVDQHQPIVVILNDRLLTVKEWDTVCPDNGDLINVKAEVTGGGGDGNKVLNTVLMIAVVAVAIMLAAPTGGLSLVGTFGATGAQLAAAGFMIAGSLLVNTLVPVIPANSASLQANDVSGQAEATQVYSLSGGSNQMRPYQSMPIVMGTHRFFPDLGSKPYTEYKDNDQYLYQIFHFGLSDLTLSDFRIGTTEITNYSEYTWYDQDSQGKISAFPGNVDSASGASLTYDAGWIQRTTSSNAYRIGIDITGVFYYANDRGGLDYTSVDVEIQYKLTSDSVWIDYDTQTIGNNSQTPIRKTIYINVSNGTYDVRVRRTTAESTDSRLQNKTSFDTLRTYQLDTATYYGQKRRGLVIRASEQLNGAIQQLSCLAIANANYWNGSAWVSGSTSNPAHWFMDFAKGRYDTNGRLTYGIGLSDSQIDLDALHAWAIFCATENLTFNAVFDGSQSAADILTTISRCGFSSPSWASGKLGVVWDGRNQTAVAQFGMGNIIKGSFSVAYATESLADEIVVRYMNPDKDWQQDEVRVNIPGVEESTNPTTVDLMGCTSQAMAGKFANYIAAQQYYRKRRISWDTDFEGFVCQRGDVVMLSHDLTQWAYSGRVIEFEDVPSNEVWEQVDYLWDAADFEWQGSTKVILDRVVPRSGSTEYFMLRQPNGTMNTYPVLPGVDSNEITLAVAPDIDTDYMAIDHIWSFSPLATPGKKVKIISVQPKSESLLTVTATDEFSEFYDAWDGSFNVPAQSTLLLDSNPVINNAKVGEYVYLGGSGAVVSLVTVNIEAKNFERANVRWRVNGNEWNKLTVFQTTFDFAVDATGTLEVQITPIFGVKIGETYTATTTLFGVNTTQVPADVTNVITVYNNAGGGQLLLNWAAINDFRTVEYEVRLGATWETAKVIGRTPLTSIACQGDGTYWIAAVVVVAGTSIYSANPNDTVVVGAILQNNVIATYDESAAWTGTVGGSAEISGGVLTLDTSGGIVTGLTGSYTVPNSHIIDAGRVTPCNVSITINGGGVSVDDNILTVPNVLELTDVLSNALGTKVTITPQIALGNNAGVFGDWQAYLPGYYNARYFKARVLIETSDETINVQVTDFIISVDVPDRVDTGQITTATSGSTVTYVAPFIGGATGMTVPAVQLTIVNAVAGDDIILSNETLNGFDVRVVNSGSGVSRTVNYLAQGY